MTLPFGLLPSAFAGDEQVSIAGVAQPLLQPASPHFQQQHQWSSSDGGQFADVIVPAPWGDHWQGLWSASFGPNTSPGQHVESSTCQPECTIHSEAYHSAALLFGKIITFPAKYVQQWRPEKTDEVLFWLNRQTALEASSPGSVSSNVTLPLQPTRQDAELLRICKYETLAQKESHYSG